LTRPGSKIFDPDPSLAETHESFQGRDPSDEEVRALLGFVDKDGDGTVDFDEFLVMMAKKCEVRKH